MYILKKMEVLFWWITKRIRCQKKGGEDELRRRYALQLEYYAKALSQLLQKPVKEKIIYSFSLGKDIVLE